MAWTGRTKSRRRWLLVASCGGLLFWSSCGNSASTTEQTVTAVEAELPASRVPVFQADSAYQFVAKQVRFGPRVPNSAAHAACGDYLVKTLRQYGAQVREQTFAQPAHDGKTLQLRNIIASYHPEAANRILLAAHWDTRPRADKDEKDPTTPADGANDGGSGVGVLLEIARLLRDPQNNPSVGVDIIFFDGEDYGTPDADTTWCYGSQYWSQHQVPANYTANFGILLDMVGARNAKFAMEGYSKQYAPDIVNLVWKTANQLGYSDYFIYADNGGINDDHVYVNAAGIRTIDIIEYDPTSPDGTFGKYHHRHTDNMEIIDPRTLKAVGQTLLHVLFQPAA